MRSHNSNARRSSRSNERTSESVSIGNESVAREVDESLTAIARVELSKASLGAWARQVHVSCHDAHLCVEGHLPSYYLKQLVQSILLRVPGCRGVENRVFVDRT